MKIKINRDELIKTKGNLEVTEEISDFELSDIQVSKLNQTLIECITAKSPKNGLFSNEGENDETT
ncbi:MAG: hypothetical protein PQJ44_07110 [Sphaerochaetaceae bacterium]|nr:hypothetical protein [Sphaerochaetaceae bacterium]